MGAVLPAIGTSLGAGVAQLGIIGGAFLAGVGVFQVPAGFAALRFGSRSVSILALVFMGAFGLAAAFSPSWEWVAASRFAAGASAAFFFSPALSLIASYYPPGQRGPVIGWYNGGFSVGGAVGLAVGYFLGAQFGWQLALLSGGGALLLVALLSQVVIPRTEPDRRHRDLTGIWNSAKEVLRSRSIWALSLALTGFWAAVYVVAFYFLQYVHTDHPDWSLFVASLLVTLVVVFSFPGGPVGGWLGERKLDRRGTLAIFAAVTSGAVLLIPFTPMAGLWPLFILLGFVDGIAFAVLYLIPAYLPEIRGDGLALGIAVINSVQVSLGSALAVAFGFVSGSLGFTSAWVFVAVIGFALLVLLILVAPSRPGVAHVARAVTAEG